MNFKKSVYEQETIKASGKLLKEVKTVYESDEFNVIVYKFYINGKFEYGIVTDSKEFKQIPFNEKVEIEKQIIFDLYGIKE